MRCSVNDTTMVAAARAHTMAMGHSSHSSDESALADDPTSRFGALLRASLDVAGS